jgi:pilus assembly protein CpaF
VSRFSDGTRRVTHITEVVGMEGDVITLQDVFIFEKTGINAKGRVTGRFKPSGLRPRSTERMKGCGIELPPEMFQSVVEIA